MFKISLLCKCVSIAALAVVLVMSLKPAVSLGEMAHIDKLWHLGTYAVLSALVRLGWPKLWGGLIFINLALFGIGIEFAQHFMNLGRTGSIADTIANLIGASIPLIIYHFFRTRHHR